MKNEERLDLLSNKKYITALYNAQNMKNLLQIQLLLIEITANELLDDIQ